MYEHKVIQESQLTFEAGAAAGTISNLDATSVLSVIILVFFLQLVFSLYNFLKQLVAMERG